MDNFSSFYSSLPPASAAPTTERAASTATASSPTSPSPTSQTAVQIALSPPSDSESSSSASGSEPSSPSAQSPASPTADAPKPTSASPLSSSTALSSSLSPVSAAIASSAFAKPLLPASASSKLAPTPRAPSSTRTTRNPSLPPRTQDRSMLSPVFPTLSSAQRVSSAATPGTGRNKVALEPGHSPLDWAQYKNSGKDLTGGGRAGVRLTLEEVAKHKTVDDCWTVLNGKVYNMTPYVKYHPGGVKQLMKGAGKDSTKLFLAVHAWVNADYLLDACFLGPLES